jgi:hypothetical protein
MSSALLMMTEVVVGYHVMHMTVAATLCPSSADCQR